ncbi:NAD(P)H-dependent oxidoreductase [Nostoc ellipsosporum NOK]|jgi:NAD(P)H dehydrogenase (quinone)|nr:NAD(P)H-dependent oxidoreductase [Nostoc ellipsosporum NOK]
MKIFVLLGHPDAGSFNGQIADRYIQSAIAAGHEVRVQKLGEMQFDPILHEGYKTIQPLEPDLLASQEHILWCEKWVIIFPTWWGSLPALLKGFLDRTLLPGFAFKYHEKDPFWDRLLSGRKAEVINTCDSPSIWMWLVNRNSDKRTLVTATLKFCGIRTIGFTRIARLRYLSDQQKEKWLKKIERMATR